MNNSINLTTLNANENIDINVQDTGNIDLEVDNTNQEASMIVGNTSENIDFNIQDTGNINFEMTSQQGTSNYERLFNKPKINSIELIGNKTGDELNLQEKGNYANTRVTNLEIDNLF